MGLRILPEPIPRGRRDGRDRLHERLGWAALSGITLGVILFGTRALVAKWYGFDPHVLDFSLTARTFEELLHGRRANFEMAYYGFFYNFLLVPVGILYALFRTHWFLVGLHVFFHAVSIPLLYQLARLLLGGVWLPLAFVGLYLLAPGPNLLFFSLQRLETAWAGVFFLFVIAILKRRETSAAVLAAILVLIRADSVFIPFLAGLLLRWGGGRWGIGRRVAAVSAFVFLCLAVGVSVLWFVSGIPVYHPQLHLLSDADAGVARLTPQERMGPFLLVVQFLCLPLLAPQWLLSALPNFLYTFISLPVLYEDPLVANLFRFGSPLMPVLHSQYSYLIPVTVVAALVGARRCLDALGDPDRPHGPSPVRTGMGILFLAFGLVTHTGLYASGIRPFSAVRESPDLRTEQAAHASACWNAFSMVPAGEDGLLQYPFWQRNYRFLDARELTLDALQSDPGSFLLADLRAFDPAVPRKAFLSALTSLLRRGTFGVAHFEDGVLLLRKGWDPERNEAVARWIHSHGNDTPES